MKKIRVSVFNEEYAVWVVWGKDYDKIKKYIQWHFDNKVPDEEFDMSNMRGRAFHVRGYMPIIWMNQSRSYDFAGTLSHEAVHVVESIFDYIGQPVDAGEIFAHSVGAIVRTVLKKRSLLNRKG